MTSLDARTGAGSTANPDWYNARSVKLAEATRVRLYLPGLGTGLADDEDDRPGPSTSARSASTNSDAARKTRSKMAKVARMAVAAASPEAPGSPVSMGPSSSTAGGGAGGLMIMVDQDVLEDKEELDEEGEEEGEAGRPPARGPSGLYRAGSGASSSSASLTPEPTGPGRPGKVGSARLSNKAAHDGGPSRQGSGISTASERDREGGSGRHNGVMTSRNSGATSTSYASSHSSSSDAARVPVWNRLTQASGAHAASVRDRSVVAPKVFKAVQAKTMTLGLGLSPGVPEFAPDPHVPTSPEMWPTWLRVNTSAGSPMGSPASFTAGSSQSPQRTARNGTPPGAAPSSDLATRLEGIRRTSTARRSSVAPGSAGSGYSPSRAPRPMDQPNSPYPAQQGVLSSCNSPLSGSRPGAYMSEDSGPRSAGELGGGSSAPLTPTAVLSASVRVPVASRLQGGGAAGMTSGSLAGKDTGQPQPLLYSTRGGTSGPLVGLRTRH